MRDKKRHNCRECKELRKQLKEKDKEIEQLRSAKVLLEYEIKELRDKWLSKRKKKLDKKEEPTRETKKKGAPKGHKGWYRKKPERIDIVEDVLLNKCPICGNKDISKCSETEEHIQEDIVLPKLEVTKYVKHHFWCDKCKKAVTGRAKNEIANSYIGPQAKSVAAFLKYIVKVSNRDIQKIFKELCGLSIVPSSIEGFNKQAREKCLPIYKDILEEIKKSPFIHVDETGCPVDGKNWWNWVFATTRISLHVIHQSRGQKVLEEILGKKYGGILLSDFLSAYNKIEAKAKQRCLIHLLRDLKKILECTPQDDSTYRYCQRLKDIIQQAIELSGKYNQDEIPENQFNKQKTLLKDSLDDFQFPDPQKRTISRIAKRLDRHKNELFTFLDYKRLPYHNNFAERMIRPNVLLRKITFGHRSNEGILNHSVLMSVLQTGKLNNKESISLIRNVFSSKEKPALSLCNSP